MQIQSIFLLFISARVFAAVLSAGPKWNEQDKRDAIQCRQASSSDFVEVYYYSNGESTMDGITTTVCKSSKLPHRAPLMRHY